MQFVGSGNKVTNTIVHTWDRRTRVVYFTQLLPSFAHRCTLVSGPDWWCGKQARDSHSDGAPVVQDAMYERVEVRIWVGPEPRAQRRSKIGSWSSDLEVSAGWESSSASRSCADAFKTPAHAARLAR
jgi:hypothetical protein